MAYQVQACWVARSAWAATASQGEALFSTA
jgi:hypothetical protein